MIQRRTASASGMSSDAASTSTSMPIGKAVAPECVLAAQLCARLCRCTARLVPQLADAAMRLLHSEAWKPLGFAHLNDFACEHLDRSGSWVRQLARLGRVCQEMPALTDAITGDDGGKPLGRAAAYEICRVAQVLTVEQLDPARSARRRPRTQGGYPARTGQQSFGG